MVQAIALKRVNPPASEPVTLNEAKLHQRIDLTDDDSLVTAMITAARQKAEEFTRRSLITQTWQMSLDEAGGVIALFRPPIQSITSIELDGVAVDASAYQFDIDGGRIYFSSKQVAEEIGGLKIQYVAGYGEASDVPEPIKEAIKQTVGHLYENRESQDMPMLARNLLYPYKVWLL